MNKTIKSIAAGLLFAVATSVSALPSFKITGKNGVSEDYVVLGQGFAKGELAATDCLKVGNSVTCYYLTKNWLKISSLKQMVRLSCSGS